MMKMRNTLFLLSALLIGLGPVVARAADGKAETDKALLGDKIDDLELDADVEEMMTYGEGAAQEINKQEVKNMGKETRDLERNIGRLKRERERLEAKSKNLGQRYIRSFDRLQYTKKENEEWTRKRDTAKNNVAQIDARVKKVESEATAVRAKTKAAREETLALDQRRRGLERRERLARSIIAKQERLLKELRSRTQQQRRENRRLENKLSQLERQVLNGQEKIQAVKVAGRQ